MARKSRKPEYRVKMLNKLTGLKAEIGAAWVNPDGTVSIVLDNCIAVQQDGNVLITLFPNDR